MRRAVIALLLTFSALVSAEEQKVPEADGKEAPKKPEKELTATQRDAQKLHSDGLKLQEKGELKKAQASFEKALELVPDNVPIMINLGLLQQRQKNYVETERLFKRVLHLQGENGLVWLLLGIASYEQNKMDAAFAHLAQAVLYIPNNAQARNYLGVVISRRGWYSGAEELLRHAIKLDPKYAEAHYNLGVLYLERVPPAVELARRHYEKSVELGGAPDPEVAKKLETSPVLENGQKTGP